MIRDTTTRRRPVGRLSSQQPQHSNQQQASSRRSPSSNIMSMLSMLSLLSVTPLASAEYRDFTTTVSRSPRAMTVGADGGNGDAAVVVVANGNHQQQQQQQQQQVPDRRRTLAEAVPITYEFFLFVDPASSSLQTALAQVEAAAVAHTVDAISQGGRYNITVQGTTTQLLDPCTPAQFDTLLPGEIPQYTLCAKAMSTATFVAPATLRTDLFRRVALLEFQSFMTKSNALVLDTSSEPLEPSETVAATMTATTVPPSYYLYFNGPRRVKTPVVLVFLGVRNPLSDVQRQLVEERLRQGLDLILDQEQTLPSEDGSRTVQLKFDMETVTVVLDTPYLQRRPARRRRQRRVQDDLSDTNVPDTSSSSGTGGTSGNQADSDLRDSLANTDNDGQANNDQGGDASNTDLLDLVDGGNGIEGGRIQDIFDVGSIPEDAFDEESVTLGRQVELLIAAECASADCTDENFDAVANMQVEAYQDVLLTTLQQIDPNRDYFDRIQSIFVVDSVLGPSTTNFILDNSNLQTTPIPVFSDVVVEEVPGWIYVLAAICIGIIGAAVVFTIFTVHQRDREEQLRLAYEHAEEECHENEAHLMMSPTGSTLVHEDHDITPDMHYVKSPNSSSYDTGPLPDELDYPMSSPSSGGTGEDAHDHYAFPEDGRSPQNSASLYTGHHTSDDFDD